MNEEKMKKKSYDLRQSEFTNLNLIWFQCIRRQRINESMCFPSLSTGQFKHWSQGELKYYFPAPSRDSWLLFLASTKKSVWKKNLQPAWESVCLSSKKIKLFRDHPAWIIAKYDFLAVVVFFFSTLKIVLNIFDCWSVGQPAWSVFHVSSSDTLHLGKSWSWKHAVIVLKFSVVFHFLFFFAENVNSLVYRSWSRMTKASFSLLNLESRPIII